MPMPTPASRGAAAPPRDAGAGGRRPAAHTASRLQRRVYGALDLGTNNCRLLIARPGANGSVTIVDAFSRVVRLGEGLLQTGALSAAAQDRAVAALAICADKLGRRGVWLTRNVATEACRRATNGTAFIERVYATTGIALDVITPREEARLAVLGCQSLIDADGPPALVFDIGGGSTELILARRRAEGDAEILAWTSVPWGVVSLAETEPLEQAATDRAPAYARMRARVSDHLGDFRSAVRALHDGPLQLLGTSGTITTLASVELGLPSYDRRKVDGCTVSVASMRRLSAQLAGLAPADRANVGCIGRDRADLVVAGCAILEAVLDCWGGEVVRVADRGIREGILRTLMQRDGQYVL